VNLPVSAAVSLCYKYEACRACGVNTFFKNILFFQGFAGECEKTHTYQHFTGMYALRAFKPVERFPL